MRAADGRARAARGRRRPPIDRVRRRRPQLLRGEPEDVLHHPVELTDAVEPGRGADVREREIGVVEQTPGEMGAPAARDLGGRRADVDVEQAAEVAGAHAQARCERVLGGVVERAVGDRAQRPAHELGRVDPAGRGLAVGPAAQARAEARGFGRGGEGVRPRVARQRRTTAPRPAVDAGGDDSGELVHVPVLCHRDGRIRTRVRLVRIRRPDGRTTYA